MRHRKQMALFVVLVSLLLTTGCSPFVDNNTIEEIAPVIFWSIDDAGKDQLKISTLVPPLTNEKKSLLTLKVNLLKQAGKNFNFIYYRELKSGQLRMLLISERVARKGVISMLNTLLTDPDISQRLIVAVVKGNFDEFMKAQLNKQSDLDYYLYRMFKHYESENQGEMSIVDLHQFMKKLYSTDPNPIMPVFKADQDNFAYEGTAFFNHDKLIATVHNMDDEIVQLLDNDQYLKQLPVPELATDIANVRTKTRMELSPNQSTLTVKVDLSGRIEEYRGNRDLSDEEELKALDHQMESYLEKHTTELLKKMQKWKVDPLQIGTLTLKPFSKPMSEKEWINRWEKMKISVDYQLHIQPLTNVRG